MIRNMAWLLWSYSLSPVLRGEGWGEGRATLGVDVRRICELPRSTASRLHGHLAPLPCPLPAKGAGRGSTLVSLPARYCGTVVSYLTPSGTGTGVATVVPCSPAVRCEESTATNDVKADIRP